jgi:hypothetical protein
MACVVACSVSLTRGGVTQALQHYARPSQSLMRELAAVCATALGLVWRWAGCGLCLCADVRGTTCAAARAGAGGCAARRVAPEVEGNVRCSSCRRWHPSACRRAVRTPRAGGGVRARAPAATLPRVPRSDRAITLMMCARIVCVCCVAVCAVLCVHAHRRGCLPTASRGRCRVTNPEGAVVSRTLGVWGACACANVCALVRALVLTCAPCARPRRARPVARVCGRAAHGHLARGSLARGWRGAPGPTCCVARDCGGRFECVLARWRFAVGRVGRASHFPGFQTPPAAAGVRRPFTRSERAPGSPVAPFSPARGPLAACAPKPVWSPVNAASCLMRLRCVTSTIIHMDHTTPYGTGISSLTHTRTPATVCGRLCACAQTHSHPLARHRLRPAF